METQNGRQPARDTAPELTAPSIRERHFPASAASFHILQSADDGRRVIAPCGELDLSTAARLEERLQGSIDTVLDLSKLSFIDSTGIQLLILTIRGAQQEGWAFTVRDPQPAVLRVIKLVGLDRDLGLDRQIEPLHPSQTT